jgi:NAD(P)-dependent dehydrogenase (short-subunit alcohol dehydrogenase family)
VVVAADERFACSLIDRLGAPALLLHPTRLDQPLSDDDRNPAAIVWIHHVPSVDRTADVGPASPPHPVSGGRHARSASAQLTETELLLASIARARAAASAVGVPLTFIALLPSRGLIVGDGGLACDLARGALEGLIEHEIGAWSVDGARLLGVVYGGIEDQLFVGQRPLHEVRSRTPMGTLGTVDQLADAVRFFGSPIASYITGTIVHVDGGWNAYSWIYPARTI